MLMLILPKKERINGATLARFLLDFDSFLYIYLF